MSIGVANASLVADGYCEACEEKSLRKRVSWVRLLADVDTGGGVVVCGACGETLTHSQKIIFHPHGVP